MKKQIFAVCDTEEEYARNFMDYISRRKNIPFEIRAFTSADSLIAFARKNHIELLLISQEAMCREIRAQCEKLRAHGIRPALGIVRVGERDEDTAYERGATRRAESLDIQVCRFLLPEDASEQDLIGTLRHVNEDPSIHGCLLFRPLPPHLDTEAVAGVLRPEKDIDAITTASMGGLLTKDGVGFAPCTATACLELLHYYEIPLKGKKIAMIGKSATVGLPTALLLMQEDATVSVCHIFTDAEDTRRFCLDVDIIISAAGCLNLIRASYVRPGQVVVDVGVNIGPDGVMHGDVAFHEVEPIVSAITPVPGGVGAVTSTVLARHVVQAASRLLERGGV